MKSNNSLLVRSIVFFGVFILIGIGAFYWWKDAIAPFDVTDTTPVVFRVERGDNVRAIASRLANERLIRSTIGFYLLVKTLGIERDIQAGEFRLDKTMDAKTIAEQLTHGMTDVWVTTLEGWRIEEIANTLAKDLDIPEKEFLAVAQEGYMFPDTYRVPKDASPAGIAQLFEDNFKKKITAQMISDAKKEGLSLGEVIILASIVEREGKSEEDRPVIAGILLNRLQNDWALQTDATLQYALGYQINGKTWWKKELSEEDKSVDSPYNTYTHTGLPPAPIANPGLAAIRAVVYPKKTDYMYYLHDTKGGVHYGKTLEDHMANIEKYLR